jgi:curli biogenesis system outer membrane secretion channel CsgG
MLAQLLVAGLLLQAATNPQGAKPSTGQAAPSGVKDSDTDPTALLKVKRIYVDSFGDDVISRELQSMIVSSLAKTKRFKVTENRERADAILKGVALEKSAQELHAYSEGTAAGRGAISDSSAHTETVSEAKLSVRLVNPDGDVIWTSTQESKGAKYKGSSADVADKCVKQLLRDVEKLESPGAPQLTAAPASAGAQRH